MPAGPLGGDLAQPHHGPPLPAAHRCEHSRGGHGVGHGEPAGPEVPAGLADFRRGFRRA